MKSMVIESAATPALTERAGQARHAFPGRENARPFQWGALYIILMVSVGLCAGGSRLVAAFGHPALIQYGVALAILGLLGAWIRKGRSALSHETSGAHVRSEGPFSVIHVAFSAASEGSSQGTRVPLSEAEHPVSASRQATQAFHR
jgi:hypothetical protein